MHLRPAVRLGMAGNSRPITLGVLGVPLLLCLKEMVKLALCGLVIAKTGSKLTCNLFDANRGGGHGLRLCKEPRNKLLVWLVDSCSLFPFLFPRSLSVVLVHVFYFILQVRYPLQWCSKIGNLLVRCH